MPPCIFSICASKTVFFNLAQSHHNYICTSLVLFSPTLSCAQIVMVYCLIEFLSQFPRQKPIPQGLMECCPPLLSALILGPAMGLLTLVGCFSRNQQKHPANFFPWVLFQRSLQLVLVLQAVVYGLVWLGKVKDTAKVMELGGSFPLSLFPLGLSLQLVPTHKYGRRRLSPQVYRQVGCEWCGLGSRGFSSLGPVLC